MLAAIFRGFVNATTVWLVVVSLSLFGAYEIARPTMPNLTPSQQALAASMAEDVGQWIRGMEDPQGLVGLPNLNRDPFGAISDSVREGVWRSGRFEVADYTLEEKLRRKLLWTRPTPRNAQEAASGALERECDYALWGQVTDYSHVHGKATLRVRLVLLDAMTGVEVDTKTFAWEVEDTVPFLAEMGGARAGDEWGAPARFLIWVALTLAMPLLTMPVATWALRRESNAMTLVALAGYVMASVFTARLLLPADGVGWMGALVLFVAFVASLWYHWHALDLLKTISAEGAVR